MARIIGTLLLAALALLAAGCASDAERRLEQNETALATGDYLAAYRNMVATRDLGRADEIGAANRALLAGYPQFRAAMEADIRRRAAALYGAEEVIGFAQEMVKARHRDLISPELAAEMQAAAGRAAREGLESGSMRFTLADDFAAVEGLRDYERTLLLDNSIAILTGDTDPPPALSGRVMEVVRRAGADSPAGRKVAAAVPAMHLSRNALEMQVMPVLPQAARQAIDARTLRLLLVGNDRLMLADLAPRLEAGSQWLVLADEPGPNTLAVDVQKLQWEERQPPEKVQTIRYGMADVTALPPKFKGPPFSSYAYELTTGEASLEYAVEVQLLRDREPIDGALLRDYLEARWAECAGSRLENPMGGAQPVSFFANRHMKQTCAGGAQPLDVRSLRAPALDRLAAAILALPAIRGAM